MKGRKYFCCAVVYLIQLHSNDYIINNGIQLEMTENLTNKTEFYLKYGSILFFENLKVTISLSSIRTWSSKAFSRLAEHWTTVQLCNIAHDFDICVRNIIIIHIAFNEQDLLTSYKTSYYNFKSKYFLKRIEWRTNIHERNFFK